jgi:transcriptional regulator GlxA family with amidase domain
MAVHRVVVLVRDGLIPLEVGIPHRIFGQARSAGGEPLYEVRTCTLRPGPVRTDTDLTFLVEHGPELLRGADTVIVPAADSDYEPGGDTDPALPAALALIPPHARIASICTGAFVLAAAGLLDGRTATTHWRSVPDFRCRFPRVRVDPDVLYTDDGRVLTSAGVASGLDLCLHLVRRDHGAAVANEVARGTVVPPHREGGQAQFVRQPVPEPADSPLGRAREWALAHLAEPIGLAELAGQAGVSTRTFTRRFRAEAGVSPMHWLIEQRLDRARELLERSDLPVDRVAAAAGFGTATALRQHFRRLLGTSPGHYRNTFTGRRG